jgi:SAM-dependent methyltransferase
MAPLDLRASSFTDGAFDACISTNTLEHIPGSDIVKIFTELRRVVRHDGLLSAVIDYSDHYAHTDARIGPLNYLQYSSAEFAKYNHSVHYQNRLRHYDYLRIFKELGYAIVEDQALDCATPPRRIAAEFDSSHPTLCATRGIFLLRNQR